MRKLLVALAAALFMVVPQGAWAQSKVFAYTFTFQQQLPVSAGGGLTDDYFTVSGQLTADGTPVPFLGIPATDYVVTGASGLFTTSSGNSGQVLGGSGTFTNVLNFTFSGAFSFFVEDRGPFNVNFFFLEGGQGQQGEAFGPLRVTSLTPVSTAVPEPATWALMILGFGTAGVAMRRRKGILAIA